MPTAVKHQLWRLVKSLTKAEKRNFKLYATRAGATSDSKFIQLFDVLDRLDTPDDPLVTERLQLSPGQYSNLKRHLYQQVLTSLRLIYINKEIDIELREQIDFSHILYGKGLYLDALRSLERAKTKAVEHNRDLLHLEILEFQKLIEARHITLSRQVDNKMDLLLNESAERSYSVLNTSELFNLNIQIHGRYIENGHSRSTEESSENEQYWREIQTRRVDRETTTSTFHQKINRFQAAMWYHYIQLSFTDSLEHAQSALNLFSLSRQMTVKDPDLYLRSLYYVNVFAYLSNQPSLMANYRKRIDDFLADEGIQLNENSRAIGKVYASLIRLNDHFARQDWTAAYNFGQELLAERNEGTFLPTVHRWGLFLYKFAAASFMLRRYDEALDCLNTIINMKSGILREDLLLNTRLLHLLCNFELDNYSLVDYHLTNFSRQMRRSRETARVHRLSATALRRLIKLVAAERLPVLRRLQEEIDEASCHPFEQKALIYLDLRPWVADQLARQGTQGIPPGQAGFAVLDR